MDLHCRQTVPPSRTGELPGSNINPNKEEQQQQHKQQSGVAASQSSSPAPCRPNPVLKSPLAPFPATALAVARSTASARYPGLIRSLCNEHCRQCAGSHSGYCKPTPCTTIWHSGACSFPLNPRPNTTGDLHPGAGMARSGWAEHLLLLLQLPTDAYCETRKGKAVQQRRRSLASVCLPGSGSRARQAGAAGPPREPHLLSPVSARREQCTTAPASCCSLIQ